MSRNTPPCGDPRPALISELMDRATSSRGSSSGGPPVVVRVGVPAVGLFLGLRVLRAEHVRHVVEHEPLALGVPQHAAVAADRLGDQEAAHRRRPDHAGRVELDELHVHQVGAREQRERVTVAAVLPGVRRDLVRPPDAAGGHDDRRRLEQHEPPGVAEVPEGAGDPPGRVLQQPGDRRLREHPDHRLGVAEPTASPPAAGRRPAAAGSGSSPGRSGRPRARAAGTRARRSSAARSCRPVSCRTARPTPPAPRPGPGPPWRAVPPSAGCS